MVSVWPICSIRLIFLDVSFNRKYLFAFIFNFFFSNLTKKKWIRVQPRYPGDKGWDNDDHGHGHGHGSDAHGEEEMNDLAGPINDFGIHSSHEDSHAGEWLIIEREKEIKISRYILWR